MNGDDIQFRMAEAADAAALGEFMERNFMAAYGHCSTPENLEAAIRQHYGEPAQLRQILDGDRCNLIAFEGERWIGHAQLHLGSMAPAEAAGLPALELSRFYIDTSFHGRGVAQAMMAHVKREALARGASSLWLSVWQEAPQAIRFYQKSEFRIAGELVFMVGDDPKDDWLMVCDLGRPA
jgi:ribosomal protein S18 acetylase RimI-like enzyme